MWDEFRRMVKFFPWRHDDEAMEQAREDFTTALTLLFNDMYGEDVKSLDSWQKLCRVCHVDPVPETMKECRAVSTSPLFSLV